ncbi:MAG: hypothetical protein Kow00123_12040 [Anaerolineales bacterium]
MAYYVHSTTQNGYTQETRTPAPSWTESKRWADAYFGEACAILERLGFSELRATPWDLDARGVDIITADGARIAWRCRDVRYLRYADITLRLSRPSGAPTEARKIKEGAVDWLFWTWTTPTEVAAWVLLRADRVAALMGEASWPTRQVPNATFVSIPFTALKAVGAIVAAEGL